MLSLPLDLLDRCRNLFLTCNQFESYEQLRAVFVTPELQPFRIGLRRENNPADLVNSFMDFILDQELSGGNPAFTVFLAALRDLYPEGNNRRNQLTQLFEEVRNLTEFKQPRLPSSESKKQNLFNKILVLDFGAQNKKFKSVINQYRIASFLIHGPPDHGQRVLTYRLARWKTEWSTGQRFVIEAGSNGVGKSSHSLWRQVAKQMQLPHDTNVYKLVEKVCEWWKTQDVIFIFYTVDYIPQEILKSWMEEFWKPISTAARQVQHLTRETTHLLLFLVDFSGHVCDYKIELLDNAEEMANSCAPFKLPPACKFPEAELDTWLNITAAQELPEDVSASELLDETDDGIPQLVYEKIFEHCGWSWEGDISL
jgi:hypothetical protein